MRNRAARHSVVWVSILSLVLVGVGISLAPIAQAVAIPVTGTAGAALVPVTPLDPSTLTPPFTLAITPALPTGLQLDPVTGAISGTPAAASAATSYTVTATDTALAVVATADVNITIDGILTTPSPIVAAFGQPLTGTPTLYTSGLGSGVQYAFSPGAPTWLEISTSGVLSGTPTASLATTSIKVTASDSLGAIAVGAFNLTVLAPLTPPTQTLTGQVGSEIPAQTVPFAVSVAGAYSTNPAITTIPGLEFNTATGVISGIPTKPVGPTPFAVQFTPAGGGAQLQATLTVTVDAVLGTTAQEVTGKVGANIIAFIGYASSAATTLGLVAPFAYSTTPALPGATSPGDLAINPTTGAITGRPTTAVVGAKYTVNVTDKNGAKASGPITVNIGGQLLPTSQALVGAVGATTTSRTIAASGMTAPVTYSISPSLPSGLSLNTSTGIVSGIPRAVQSSTAYDVSATDANGATGAAKLTITVSKALLSPPVIGAIQAGLSAGSIIVNFTTPRLAPADQTYTVEVYDATGSDLVTSVDSKVSPVTITALDPGETYQIVVIANATSAYDRVESLPKSATASMKATSPIVSSAPASATVVSKATTPTTLSQQGFVLAVGTQTSKAKRVTVAGLPTRKLSKSPVVRIPMNSYTRIMIRGVRLAGPLTVSIRIGSTWFTLGSARANTAFKVRLPAFAARKAGTYAIKVAGATGKPVYVKLVVSSHISG
jgi:hypothetical protein